MFAIVAKINTINQTTQLHINNIYKVALFLNKSLQLVINNKCIKLILK